MSVNEKKTWSDSLAHCLSVNSTLATIHDNATNYFLFNLAPPFSSISSSEYWLGGVRTAPTGDNFAWLDQSPFDYQNWAPPQPLNGGNETKLQVFKGLSGDGKTYDKPKWNDRAGWAELYSICQYNLIKCQ